MKEIKLESEEQVLKLFRKKLKKEGWTQRWLASTLGYDTTTINAWFCRRARLKVDACVDICKALGWEIVIRPKEDNKDGKQ